MTRAGYAIAAILAAAICLLIGASLRCPPPDEVRWMEGDDGLLPADPYPTWTAA